jgi:cytochrome o ubiquinol oxidase subunit IV
MSDSMHNSTKHGKKEHLSAKPYVIGFIFSLILTIIPYYLVVNQNITGTNLLVVILGFALMQMVVQVTFFLHIGRGPKPNWNLFFFASTFGIILVVVGGSIIIIDNLHYNMASTEKVKKLINDEGIHQVSGTVTGACKEFYDNHKITIRDGQVNPTNTDAKLCDTLTFINEDDQAREITFGTHPDHGAYAGEYELTVRKGRSKTVPLSELGSYQFHDHLQAETAGSFTVSE